MNTQRITVAILAAGLLLAAAKPAHAQIASYVDANGKRVFINGDSPGHHSGGTISSPATRPAAVRAVTSLSNRKNEPGERDLDRIIVEAAARHQVDPALVKAVINTESGGNPVAVSRKGAMGLMQLVPGTAERFGVGNPFDPAQNVEGGTTYLKALLDRYNGDLSKSLAAYNAGERAVDVIGGVPWFPETRRYVRKVTDAYFRPDSGHDLTLLSVPRAPVRQETDSNGRVIFTNE